MDIKHSSRVYGLGLRVWGFRGAEVSLVCGCRGGKGHDTIRGLEKITMQLSTLNPKALKP